MTPQEQHERRARAHDSLRSELILALTNDPTATVSAPAFHRCCGGRMTAVQVVADQVDGTWDDAALAEALRIVGMCARGAVGAELQARAQAWIAGRATEHADFHAATMAAEGVPA
jgi:hypothetical protein